MTLLLLGSATVALEVAQPASAVETQVECPLDAVTIPAPFGVAKQGWCATPVATTAEMYAWVWSSTDHRGPNVNSKPFGKIEKGSSITLTCQIEVKRPPVPGFTQWVLLESQATLDPAEIPASVTALVDTATVATQQRNFGWASMEVVNGSRTEPHPDLPSCYMNGRAADAPADGTWAELEPDQVIQDGAVFVTEELSEQPEAPTGPFQTPVPEITLDSSQAPDLAEWLDSTASHVKDWYPVIGDAIAYPGYEPPTSFEIKLDTEIENLGEVRGTEMKLNADHFRENPDDLGTVIHETAHIVQSLDNDRLQLTPNRPRWIAEGIADWVREHVYVDRATTLLDGEHDYTKGYGTTASFLHFGQHNYNQRLVYNLNQAYYQGTYTEEFWVKQTGHDLDVLWTESLLASQEPTVTSAASAGTSAGVAKTGGDPVNG